jgi:hypothetical protein
MKSAPNGVTAYPKSLRSGELPNSLVYRTLITLESAAYDDVLGRRGSGWRQKRKKVQPLEQLHLILTGRTGGIGESITCEANAGEPRAFRAL